MRSSGRGKPPGPIYRPPRPEPLPREDPETHPPPAVGRSNRDLVEAIEVDGRDEDAFETLERRTARVIRELEERGPPVSYGPPAPSLRTLVEGFERWARRRWWVLVIVGSSGGAVGLNRLWELVGVATKADLDRVRSELQGALDAGIAPLLDGGANDSKAREALDGGAYDQTARVGVAEAAANTREAWLAARRAAQLAGVDAGAVEAESLTVKPR